ncbi:MAG: transcriptional regulator [Zunongwangia sp.]|mgnify:CR=1 FL=1|uniref:helix-turn-helix transcriptional regulator n=1 Tax=Zunongwangia profunda TaxID=398743 RepID=UPI000C8F502D|nr:helix-turn-helix transcriptional regulator [Zunongwangia profunda]MAG86165.1 transcriptional regulator [Flavobacteriaceae bacterium]MAO36501.1 transcriptional regulator [Zunongwangia sp.]|tara:strand:+ start:2831 stop:3211 length:381 start_codon:yes stop_codon:yes gene_type:complete
MTTTKKRDKRSIHMGYNVAKLRSFLGIKQEAIAQDLKISQQQMSQLERQEVIEEEVLRTIAESLGTPIELIKNFDEEAVIYNINHYNVHDNSFSDSSTAQVFNPVEKIVELYERLLESERKNLREE